ncbi:MAG: PVC-type heme-binding CxxCH protein [Gemmataceae bacterium]
MRRWFTPLAVLALAGPAFGQVPPDKALATMRPGDGLQVELFAAEPLLINPTSIDVDHKGRVWVCEGVNYRCTLLKKPINRPEGDRIVVLTDTDGDGKADTSTVFYQGRDLQAPLGIAVAPDAKGVGCKVYVCQSPDILVFEDKDGDGKADGPPKKLLTGFRGIDHDHGVHGINIGPDGKLYFTVGDSGVDGLQSSDGQGKKWKTNNTDCQAGTVWRCDMDGKNLELIAHNFRNNYECCVDSFGEIWLSDNDDDGNQQTRICHVLPGGNYGYWPRGPGQSHWHEEQPGVVHKTLRTGFGSPCGITFYEGALLPEKFRGQLLHADAGPREIRCFHRKPKGAGYELDKTLMLTSTDNWFRPSDVCVAPDGSVFVADWYDPGVGGHGMGDKTRGRIYRLTPAGHKGYTVPTVKLDTSNGQFAALASPCLATRAMVQPTMMAGNGVRDVFNKTSDWALRARVFWHLARVLDNFDRGGIGVASVENPPDSFRAMVTRLHSWSNTTIDAADASLKEPKLSEVLGTQPVAILREGALAARNINLPLAKELFYSFAKRYDGHDIFYRAALNIACGTDPTRRDAILADFDKHFPEWNDTVADLVWELRPKSVLPRLDKLLADPKLTAAQKGRIVDILAVTDDPAAGKTVLALLAGDQPAEVRAKALANLRLFLPTKWKPVAESGAVKEAVGKLLGSPATVPVGLQLVAAARYTAAVEDVAKLTADPAARAEAVRTLGQLRDPKAVAALAKLTADPTAVAALGEQASGQPNTESARAALTALKAIVTGPDSATRSKAVEALAGTRAGTGWLLQQKEQGKLPADLVAVTGRLLRNSPFQGERNKAMILFPATGKLDPKALPSPAELAKRTGDPAKGKAIWAKSLTSEVQCARCHTVRGQGGQIGPDLSAIGTKGSKENLFESVLQPSKAIADQSVTWKIDTADGQSISGLLMQETADALTLRDANGKDYKIATKDVEKRSKSLVSLMPDDLVKTLTEDELVDLVAYLTTLRDEKK